MELLFEPGAWHTCSEAEWRDCSDNANCYAYALNRPDYFWAVPGMGFAKAPTRRFLDSATQVFEAFPSGEAFTEALVDGAIRDGLLPVDTPTERDGYYLVALVVNGAAGERDFHWYRRDDDGIWSHKNGYQAPSNTDSTGKMIRDPRDISDPQYPLFGGFFLVPRSGVRLRRDFPV